MKSAIDRHAVAADGKAATADMPAGRAPGAGAPAPAGQAASPAGADPPAAPGTAAEGPAGGHALPFVSVVYLAYNRRAQVLESLAHMTREDAYPQERLELIIVDNASTDGTAAAVRERHPQVELIVHDRNLGASGWNAGFAAATGRYVLILDDDAYMRPGELERAVRAAVDADADLVSFSIVSDSDESTPLNEDWQTGLLSYWGCAALLSKRSLDVLDGYDPNIFIWCNEVELTMRLLDNGFCHLYLPEIRGVHMKERITKFDTQRYMVNARHHAYMAAKLMRAPDAFATAAILMLRAVNDYLFQDRSALPAIKEVLVGFARGWRNRQPVRPLVSATYRHAYTHFAPPWAFMRSPLERLRSRGDAGAAERQRTERQQRYYDARRRFYPTGRGSLRL